MTFFESLQLLLVAAVVLLQVARRLAIPYPAMLALAGVGVALIPGSPTINIDPHTALALFIAPALLDAAYDFPLGAARKLWRPLLVLAIGAVLVTTAVVAWIGWAFAGLPIAAAIALGAVVAPPDAAAATAVLSSLSIPRSSAGVLTGESLFNDATALLLFSGALAVQANGGMDGPIELRLALAAPGGILFGIGCAWLMQRANRFVTGTLGGNLLQFVQAFLVWLIAERLELSAVLAVVACAMTIAHRNGGNDPRMRVHSFAVWATVVFVLNVLAFLLMGMQARTIVGHMAADKLWPALRFAGYVVLAVIVTRIVIVLAFNRLAARFVSLRGDRKPATIAQGILVGWSGMRGLVTLATAFALPQGFPERDLLVLTAFAVVLATLVLQGLTLTPLIHLLKLDRSDHAARAIDEARGSLAKSALKRLEHEQGSEADELRADYRRSVEAIKHEGRSRALDRHRGLGLAAVRAQRHELEKLRAAHALDAAGYYALQEELDWRELSLLPEDARQIEES